MDPERYRRVDQVFQQALSQTPDSVESFLREACGDDEDLRREVQSLLAHDRQAGSLIDSPVPSSIAMRQADQKDEDFSGRTLLHYQIVEKIGSESKDGRFLYYSRYRQKPGVYRIPVSGGSATLIFEAETALVFALTDSGIYFVDYQPRPPVLMFYDFATRRAKTIVPFHSDPAFTVGNALRISPDGQWLFYYGGIFRSEIMLMENFR